MVEIGQQQENFMEEHDQAITLTLGAETALPHTMADARHLKVSLVDTDPSTGAAALELRNPEAGPDELVEGLIEQHEEDVEKSNRWRERLHLPEKAVPVDTETKPVVRLDCKLDEKLDIGDRQWTVTEIAADHVVLTPGADHEDGVLEKVADAEVSASGTAVENGLNALNGAF